MFDKPTYNYIKRYKLLEKQIYMLYTISKINNIF